MLRIFYKQKGMTLVEVLAALVILGIVFIGFSAVFPQMSILNLKTEEKLESMNLAKKELMVLKDTSTNRNENFQDHINSNKGKYMNEIIPYKYEVNGYLIEVDFYEKEELKKNSHPDSIQLHKIHIQVTNDGEKISETFGYIEQ